MHFVAFSATRFSGCPSSEVALNRAPPYAFWHQNLKSKGVKPAWENVNPVGQQLHLACIAETSTNGRLFGPLKSALRGRVFKTNDEVKAAVQSWLRHQPKEFYAAGILNLVQRWDRCILKGGEFLEK